MNMKRSRTISNSIFLISILIWSQSSSLVRDPLAAYSAVTEGVNEAGEYVAFRNKAAVVSHLQLLYNQIRDRQEHWYLDYLLIGDAHADNAYAGTTGAELLPFENNAIDGSNSVLARDWDRFMED